ncbi:hypothetical protein B1C78_03340 [Thioalkalivibrio denitrificans]|uniref:Probable membrane transporter protein n=1 Tax=Thioalkalivibrio denitrificans TaxID=108003 RepID=A0A1V3NRQ6_9GAMM|nr:sulfite exporter TauE/SafE family protein [Thioalkalivibrio denitrificans]OOG27694.1 hypothetical protein B1C78_03340 [Thioalkalivibrio denitrificans]
MWFEIGVLVFGAFAASLAAGASGFAFGLVGMAIWLHAISPARAVPLVILCSILLNMALIWRLWSSVDMKRLKPFLVGAVVGVPLGVAALRHVEPGVIRQTVGALLIVYSLYMVTRATMPVLPLSPRAGRTMDTGVGALGGFMGGSTSLNGIFPTLWCGIRGWTPREQRGVFQPYVLLVHLYTLAWLGGTGTLGRQTLHDILWCVPFVAAGGYIGLQLFHRTSEAGFRRLMLGLFIVSGVLLLI